MCHCALLPTSIHFNINGDVRDWMCENGQEEADLGLTHNPTHVHCACLLNAFGRLIIIHRSQCGGILTLKSLHGSTTVPYNAPLLQQVRGLSDVTSPANTCLLCACILTLYNVLLLVDGVKEHTSIGRGLQAVRASLGKSHSPLSRRYQMWQMCRVY